MWQKKLQKGDVLLQGLPKYGLLDSMFRPSYLDYYSFIEGMHYRLSRLTYILQYWDVPSYVILDVY